MAAFKNTNQVDAAGNVAIVGAGAAYGATVVGGSVGALAGASVAATTLATGAALAAGAIVLTGVCIGIVMGLIGLLRIGPDVNVTVGGAKGLKQLSGMDALKQWLGVAYIVAAFAAIKKIEEKIYKSVGLIGTPSSPGAAQNANINNGTRINPASVPLYNNAVAIITFARSTATFWSTSTGTTVGAEWWQASIALANTSTTGSYVATLLSAKNFTDEVTGVVSNSGIMTLDQIIAAGSTTTSTATILSGIITPSVQDFAGTLFYQDYINSATTAISSLLYAATTATTQPGEITTLKQKLDLYTQNLQYRLNLDLANQSKYLAQSAHLTNIVQTAQILNSVQKTQSGDVYNLFQSTIHPNVLDTVQDVSTLLDVNSLDTATSQAAILKLNQSANISANYSDYVSGMPSTTASGASFTLQISSGPPNGAVTMLDQKTGVSTLIILNSSGNQTESVALIGPTGNHTVTLTFSDGTVQTYVVAVT
jgi:hypothetical protein